MDHLPCDKCPPPIKIPYICKEKYNHGEEWLEYPETQGFTLDDLRYHQYQKYAPQTLAPFLQSWLYFGLLFAIFPSKPDVSDFVYEDGDGGKFITTSKLGFYLEKWEKDSRTLSKKQKLKAWQKNASVLTEAFASISPLANWPEAMALSVSAIPPVSREMGLSFAILGRALEVANRDILNPPSLDVKGWGHGSLLLEHMEAQGWCPFLIAGIDEVLSLDGKYFAATMGPPRVVRNHRTCTDEKCKYIAGRTEHTTASCPCIMLTPSIDEMVRILAQEKLPLVRFVTTSDDGRGGIRGNLEVVPEEPGTIYVAISHVWSDGLGNFAGNSMPACQLARIQKAVNSLYHKVTEIEDSTSMTCVPFWMDTILIPNDPKLVEIKDATILRMTQIYRNARDVLIIDSEVAACSITSEPLDILLRIYLSNWLRRLWTLQEGVFANSSHFLLSDGGTISIRALLQGEPEKLGVGIISWLNNYSTYPFKREFGKVFKPELISQQRGGEELSALFLARVVLYMLKLRANNIFQAVIQLLRYLKQIIPSSRKAISAMSSLSRRWSMESAVILTIRAISDRTSTFQSDEALCMALLLEIDPEHIKPILAAKEKLAAFEKEEKKNPKDYESEKAQLEKASLQNEMILILLKLLDTAIPPDVLNLVGPYQTRPGFRWAPVSFLKRPSDFRTLAGFPPAVSCEYPSSELMDRLPSTLCSSGGGLTVMFPGLRLGKVRDKFSLRKRFIVDTAPSQDRSLTDKIIEGKPPRVWIVDYRDEAGNQAWEEIAPDWKNSGNIALVICSYSRKWQDNSSSGIMVRIKEKVVENGGEESMHVERICRVGIRGAPDYDNQYWIKRPDQRVSGSWLPVTQKWCVD